MTLPIQLVIPAAGLGSRFKDVGVLTPKPLILIDGIPMILWVAINFNLKAKDSITIVCQKSDAFPEALAKYLPHFPFIFRFVEIDGITNGPASTVALVLHDLDPDLPLIVANSDQFVSHDLSEFVSSVRNCEYAGTILTMQASGSKWSYIGRNKEGRITEIVEKREISEEATVGVYAWSRPIFLEESIKYLRTGNLLVNGEYYVAPSYGHLISKDLPVGTFSVGKHGFAVHGLGTPQDLGDFLAHPKFSEFSEKMNCYKKLDFSGMKPV